MFDKWQLEDLIIHLEYAKAKLEEEATEEEIKDVKRLIRLVRITQSKLVN